MPLPDYLISVAVAAFVVGILEFLSYSSKAKESARLCAAVILIHALLTPVLSFAASISDSPSIDLQVPGDIPYDSVYEETAKDAFKDGICKLLCSKYELDQENVTVFVSGFDVSKMCAEQIVVLLSGSAVLSDARGMESYLNGLSLGNCEVRIRIG